MGTNYYARTKICSTCKKPQEEIHLGKSSAGWQFSFQYNGGKYYKKVTKMREWLKQHRIFDEYGEERSQDYFWNLVKEKQTQSNLNHAEKYSSSQDFIIEGYSFSDVEFS